MNWQPPEQEWKLCVDPVTKRQYIYNEKLGCSRWLWERYYDENTKHFYLCNILTGQSVWEITSPTMQYNWQGRTNYDPPTQQQQQSFIPNSKTTSVRHDTTNTVKNTNQLEYFTPDGRKYYWDPVTKTSRWATETTSNQTSNVKKEENIQGVGKSQPKVSIKYTKKAPVKLQQPPAQTIISQPKQEETGTVEQPKMTMENTTDIGTQQQDDKKILPSSGQSTRTTLSDSNSIVQSVSKIDMDSSTVAQVGTNTTVEAESTETVSNSLQVKRRKKPKESKACLWNTVEPVVMKADTGVRIIGTSVALEKPYLRLTSVPDPKDVRPYSVLKKALRHVKSKYKKKKWSYNYACEQLKSIRQDMTVQGVEDALAVQVYETHGRLALENNDMDEFIQCLTCLSQLYTKVESEHRIEFMGYRILYATYVNSKDLLTSILSELNRKERNLWEVDHATQVWNAVAVNNWTRFFVLYTQCPHLGFYLMDKIKDRIRQIAVNHLRKAFKVDNIDFEFLCRNFGFENTAECIEFFERNEFIFNEKKTEIVVAKK